VVCDTQFGQSADCVLASEGAGPRKVLGDVTAGSVVNFYFFLLFVFFCYA